MSIQIGVVSRSFPELTHAQIAQLMAEAGVASTELCLVSAEGNYWAYNGISDMTAITDAKFLEIVNEYRSCGVYVASLGVFTNLITRDADFRRQCIAHFVRHMELAHLAGIPCVATEIGFTPHERGVNTDRYESDFELLKDTLSQLLVHAERFGLDIALETCVLDIVPSAKRARDLIEQLGSPRLKVLLDPANLIANSDEEDMFKYLSKHVAYFHGKDRHVNDTYGRLVGDGDIDWVKFLRLYHEKNEGTPFILEYVNAGNFRETMARVRAYDARAL